MGVISGESELLRIVVCVREELDFVVTQLIRS